jgi:hypothetical protein
MKGPERLIEQMVPGLHQAFKDAFSETEIEPEFFAKDMLKTSTEKSPKIGNLETIILENFTKFLIENSMGIGHLIHVDCEHLVHGQKCLYDIHVQECPGSRYFYQLSLREEE